MGAVFFVGHASYNASVISLRGRVQEASPTGEFTVNKGADQAPGSGCIHTSSVEAFLSLFTSETVRSLPMSRSKLPDKVAIGTVLAVIV
ncbi:hypothetical protein IMSAGC015_01756 [Lachnospiraceae bacterium]|nr:hypothetical protein IMSAGC015_01756 [Lachnospiraceae bacterium]